MQFRYAMVLLAAMVSPVLVARGETVSGLGGKVKMEAPADWKSVPPKINMIEAEFQVPGAAGVDPARLTFMSAGGSLEANIDRWVGQFKLPEGTKPTTEKKEVAGCTIHFVEVTGTYKDSKGPFAPGPAVERPDYSLLGAIIVKDGAQYFAKMVGPKSVIDGQREPFKKMVSELKSN